MIPRSLSVAALVAALPLALPAQSIRNLTQSEAVRKVWAPVAAVANRSVVEVCVDDRPMVLGTVVGAHLVVTKYSELGIGDGEADARPALSVDRAGKSWPCALLGFDRPSDLALLRVEEVELVPITWATNEPEPGAFLASVDGDEIPFGTGILAAAAYVHTVQRAFLGIRFANPDGGEAAIDEAVEHGAARAAGIRGGDVVVMFGGEEITGTAQLRSAIQKRKPGETVKVEVVRDGERMAFDVELGTNTSPIRSNQESVWGELSEVRSGFQKVLQHDTVLEPADCGGPVIDLSGKAVGVNVARAGRVETLAVPAREVMRVVRRLGGGGKGG